MGQVYPYELTGTPRPGSTWAVGIAATRRPGSRSLEPRMPEPITTEPVFATASSTSTSQSAGSPTGVIPPYSIPVAAVTASTGANDAFLASRCLRTSPFTSARVVARTMQAAYIVFPPRLAAMTTQFADSVGETPYRSQNAAVSARAGSISATRTSSATGQSRSAAATGAASRCGWDNAGLNDSTSLMPPSNQTPRPEHSLWAGGTTGLVAGSRHLCHHPGRSNAEPVTRPPQRHEPRVSLC